MFSEKYLNHSEYLVNLCEKTTIDKKHYETLRRYAHKFDDTILDNIDPEFHEKKNHVETWPKFFKHRYAFFDTDCINIDVQITGQIF